MRTSTLAPAQTFLQVNRTGFHRRGGTCRHCRQQKRVPRPEATAIDSATVRIELREEHVGARTCWTTKSHNARRQPTPCMSSWVSTRVSNRRSGDTGGQLRRGWHLERHGNLVRGQVFSSKNQLLLDLQPRTVARIQLGRPSIRKEMSARTKRTSELLAATSATAASSAVTMM